MKPIFLKVANSPASSIDIRHEITPYFKNPWHFHPELELTLILQGTGTKFIGDSISSFHENELTLTGSGLPHYWYNDRKYYQDDKALKAEAIIIRFGEHFLGRDFFQLPEMHRVNDLLRTCRRGLQIVGRTKEKVIAQMNAMMQMDGTERLITLVQILNSIAASPDYRVLSSRGFAYGHDERDGERINDVYMYVLGNFRRSIPLAAAARLANMNPAAFCRYFKKKTGKTFTHFLHEIRIGYACKLLIDDNYNVSEVCYECGFQNQSYFIKQFKRFKNQTPLQYHRQHNKLSPTASGE